MEEVDGEELVKTFAEEMEKMLGRKMKSVKVLKSTEEFSFDMTFNPFRAPWTFYLWGGVRG